MPSCFGQLFAIALNAGFHVKRSLVGSLLPSVGDEAVRGKFACLCMRG